MRDEPDQNPEEVQVTLKPFLGMAPTTYLPVIYAILAVAVIFLLLFLPGIVNGGSRLLVVCSPGFASVSVDGTVSGVAGTPFFVEAGERVIQVAKPGYETFSETIEIRRRLVGSLFVPRKQDLSVTLFPAAEYDRVRAATLAFSEWALVGEASGQYQFPPLARELGMDLGLTGDGELYAEFRDYALRHVASEAQLNDLLAGDLLAQSAGYAPSPLAFASVLQEMAVVAAGHPGTAEHLSGIASGLRRENVEDSGWAAAAAERSDAAVELAGRVDAASGYGVPRTVGNTVFVVVPGGSGVLSGGARAERGGDIPYLVDMPSFLVSQAEVTVGAYAAFVAAVPEWSVENRAALVDEGLVDAEYLRDWEDGAPQSALPVRNVSAHAAEAYAQWFSSTTGGGVSASLPTEAQWDYLAALDAPESGVFATSDISGPTAVIQSSRGSLGLYGLAGNVWEWTATPFGAASRVYDRDPSTGLATEPAMPSAHRVVRGGGWATPIDDFTIDDRGSLPPDWCSGAVGFRLVISEL